MSKKTVSLFDFMDYDYEKLQEKDNSKSLSSKNNTSEKKIDDFGEKIGGARKDYYNYTHKEIENLNEVEVAKIMKKSNFWESPKYEDLHEKGYSAESAVFIRALYLATTASLSKAHVNDKDVQHKYFEFINDMKDIVDSIPTDKTPKQVASYVMGKFVEKGYMDKIGDNRYGALPKFQDLYSIGYIKRTFMERVTYKLDNKLKNEIKNASWDKLLSKDNKTIKRKSIRKQINEIEYLENYLRIGENATDYRKGKDVTVEDFWNKFKFRAGEFGNYMTQKERQKILNASYDAFLDLAKVLNISPESIGLNGKLAIAFGARGTGGIGAANAHYEPSKIVINLTKFKGGGSLAHEWFHALDNYMDARSKNKDVSSEFASMINTQKAEYNGDYTPFAKASMLIKATSIALKYSKVDLLNAINSNSEKNIDTSFNYLDRLKELELDAKNKRKNKEFYVSRFETALVGLGKTDYYQSSLNLDSNRKKQYFSKDIEMAARAFEAFVYEEMANKQMRNDFLVNPKKSKPDLWNVLGLDYPYPKDSERSVFNKAFEQTFQYISNNNLLDREIKKDNSLEINTNKEIKSSKDLTKDKDSGPSL